MATYNRSRLLDRSIKSVLNQTFPNWELIIVDDGSSDDTKNHVKELKKNDHRIKYIHKKHLGIVATRNFALKKCNGDYITFLDSDDAYRSDHLAHHAKLIKKNQEVDLFYGGLKVIGSKFVPDVEIPGKKISISKCTPGGTFFIKNIVISKVGGFPNKEIGEDHALFLQIKKLGYKVKKLRAPSYIYYRTEPDEITKQKFIE